MLATPNLRVLSKMFKTYPPGRVTALIGPPSSGKSTICMDIITDNLGQIPIIYFELDRPVHDLLKSFVDQKEASKTIRIIDGYSWLVGEKPIENGNVLVIENLNSPPDISVTVSSAICQMGEKSIFVLDSFSSILNYITEDIAYRLLNSLVARLRQNNCWGFIAIEGGIHSEQFYNKVKHILDCILEFKIESDDMDVKQPIKRFFRVFACRFGEYDSRWHLLTQSKGIDI